MPFRRAVRYDKISSTYNTQLPEVVGYCRYPPPVCRSVPTHSRLKAAGQRPHPITRQPAFQHTAARRRLARRRLHDTNWARFQHTAARRRLGGVLLISPPNRCGFNTQPPEGGWGKSRHCETNCRVSTHSRPKAADQRQFRAVQCFFVSTHSRPKAAESLSKALLHQVLQPRFR